MAGRVPLARRNLLADRRRLLASVVGVGLALMLILLLDGIWVGINRQLTAYEDHAGAALYVVQPGTRSFFADASVIPISTRETVTAAPGVDWTAIARPQFTILELHGRKVPVALVGYEPGSPGGPWAFRGGGEPRAGELALDANVADRHHVGVGDEVTVLGEPLRVSGLTTGTSTFMVGYAFTDHDTLARLLRAEGSTGYILVGTRDPGAVRNRLEAQGLTVLSKEEIADNGRRLIARVYGPPIRLMAGVGLAVGALVVALTVYASVVDHRREYGIVRAVGARTADLVGLATRQTAYLAGAGLGAGLVLFVAARALIAAWRPEFAIVLTPAALTRAALAASAMSLVAAVVPALRLARLDPAIAYRGA